MNEVREILLSLPISEVILSVFFAACVIGAAFTCAGIAIRALPDFVRDFRAWRFERKAVLEEQPGWMRRHPSAPRRH